MRSASRAWAWSQPNVLLRYWDPQDERDAGIQLRLHLAPRHGSAELAGNTGIDADQGKAVTGLGGSRLEERQPCPLGVAPKEPRVSTGGKGLGDDFTDALLQGGHSLILSSLLAPLA